MAFQTGWISILFTIEFSRGDSAGFVGCPTPSRIDQTGCCASLCTVLPTNRRSSLMRQAINLSRQNKVGLSQPIDSMRPGCDLSFAPAQHDVGMMPLLLGNRAHLIDESQSRLEVSKLVAPDHMMLLDNIPVGEFRQLVMNLGKFFPLQRRNTAAAGNTGLIGKGS